MEDPLRFRPEEPAQRVANQIDVENDDGGGGGGGGDDAGDDDVKDGANTESYDQNLIVQTLLSDIPFYIPIVPSYHGWF